MASAPWRLAAAASVIALTVTACGPTDQEIADGGLPAADAVESAEPAAPVVPDMPNTPTPAEPVEQGPPALWETRELDPSAVILNTADDFFVSQTFRPEGVVLQTYDQAGDVLGSITLDGEVCGAITVGSGQDGMILTGAHTTTPAEGLNPAVDRSAIVAYHPTSYEVAWAVDIPDADKGECFGLEEQSVSASGTWVALTAGRWEGRAIRVEDGHLTDPVSSMPGQLLPWVGDLLAHPTEESGTGEWKVIDPATGDLQYLLDAYPANAVTVGGLTVMNDSTAGVAIDPATGQEAWRWPTALVDGNHTYPTGDAVLFTSTHSDGIEGVTAITVTDGSPAEAYSLPTREVCGVNGDRVVVAVDDQVVVVDATTGEQLDYATLPTPGCGAGLVGDHLINVGGVTRVLE